MKSYTFIRKEWSDGVLYTNSYHYESLKDLKMSLKGFDYDNAWEQIRISCKDIKTNDMKDLFLWERNDKLDFYDEIERLKNEFDYFLNN